MKLTNTLYWACVLLGGLALVALAAFATFAQDAQAEESGEGLYLSVGGGQVRLGGFCDKDEQGCENEEPFYALGGGYQFNPYIALDGRFIYAKGFDKIYRKRTPNNRDADVATSADFLNYAVGTRLMLPFESMALFGSFGGHLWEMDAEGQGSAMDNTGLITPTSIRTDIGGVGIYYGLGLQYNFRDNLSLRAEYTHYAVGEEDLKENATYPQDYRSYHGSLMFYF